MRKTLFLAAGVSVALVGLGVTAPADATGATGVTAGHSGHPAAKGAVFPTVAAGLHEPRQLSFAKSGKLFIAEAGSGGTKNCLPGAEGGKVCWGTTGSVTVVANSHQERVITGLPSYADQHTGASALGPADVVPLGKGQVAVTVGYGFAPASRADLRSPGDRFGTLLRLDLHGHVGKLGDLAAFEGKHNPIHDPNTDPTGVFKRHSTYYVTDSGGNDLLQVRDGNVKLVKVFRDETTGKGKVQSVPTDVAVGPDHALYVCELTGAPFVKGAAKIYRIAPGSHKATVWANHLTNVTSMAFGKDGKLYAVQISNGGLADTGPTGSLWRVAPRKSHKKSRNLTGDLLAPYGVAIKGKHAYVTTGAITADEGSVIKVPLA